MSVLKRDDVAAWAAQYPEALAEAVGDNLLDTLIASLVTERARRHRKPLEPVPARISTETFFGVRP